MKPLCFLIFICLPAELKRSLLLVIRMLVWSIGQTKRHSPPCTYNAECLEEWRVRIRLAMNSPYLPSILRILFKSALTTYVLRTLNVYARTQMCKRLVFSSNPPPFYIFNCAQMGNAKNEAIPAVSGLNRMCYISVLLRSNLPPFRIWDR